MSIKDSAMQLPELGMDLKQEDDAAGFLGVTLEQDSETGLLEMKQAGLIKHIIKSLGLDDGAKRKFTPSESKPLVKDVNGELASGAFSYSSVVCYLKQTCYQGMVMNPSSNVCKIDAYPDADVAGIYGHEQHTDPACTKSWTGCIITFADCPILWQSKLQTEMTLSTMEAEIIALSACCRGVSYNGQG